MINNHHFGTILPKAGKMIFQCLFNLNFDLKKAPATATKTKILPKAGKMNFQSFFVLNFKRKNQPPKPRSCQTLERIHFSIPSLLNFHRKKQPPKASSCQKLQKSIFQFFLISSLLEKNPAAKTKIFPKAGTINFSKLFHLNFIRKESDQNQARFCQKLEKQFFHIFQLELFE